LSKGMLPVVHSGFFERGNGGLIGFFERSRQPMKYRPEQ